LGFEGCPWGDPYFKADQCCLGVAKLMLQSAIVWAVEREALAFIIVNISWLNLKF
jgi:hypothetical protein